MFRANPEHTGVFDQGGIVPSNTELWRFKTENDLRLFQVVANGVVYVGSGDGNLYAIDAVTGTEKWRFKTGDIIFSSPAVSNGIVYVGSNDNNLYAIDAVTGKEKWRFITATTVYSSPVVMDGIVYIGSGDNNIHALDAATGREVWYFALYIHSLPAVSNGVIYIASGGYLHAIDIRTGEKWYFGMGSNDFSSPVVSNGVVYVGGGNYFVKSDNFLYAINAETGKEKWRFSTGDGVVSEPVVSNGVVYFGSHGTLYAVGVPSSQVNTPTSASPQTVAPNQDEATNIGSTHIWDRNNLIYLVLLVFVFLFGALLYDTYYKKKK
jgi:outer membrane protein assembly factor BamB